MSETAILEQLEKLTEEIRLMKAEIQELKREPTVDAVPDAGGATIPGDVSELDALQLREVCNELLSGLDDLKDMTSTFKAGAELTEDLQPIVKQAFPDAVKFCTDVEDDFDIDELVALLRKVVTNFDTIGSGIDMLKGGIELRDDLIPILYLAYPKLLKALTSLHEGEFRAERLGHLLHTILINIHTLSDLLNMVQPVTELLKEVTVIVQQTDMLTNMNKWLDSLQDSSPVLRLAVTAVATGKRLDLNEARVTRICDVIKTVDFEAMEPLGPVGMVRQMRDPKVREALGFFFMVLQTVGGCLQAGAEPGPDTVQKNE